MTRWALRRTGDAGRATDRYGDWLGRVRGMRKGWKKEYEEKDEAEALFGIFIRWTLGAVAKASAAD